MCILACRLELKWSQDNPYVTFLPVLCVLMMWSDWGGALERVQIFILAEKLKIECFLFFGIIR